MKYRPSLRFGLALATAAALLVPAEALAQSGGQWLGTVQLSRDVVANGQRLTAGTYLVRQIDLPIRAVVGQTVTQSRWVEFVQDGEVKGRELATVLTGPQVQPVLNPSTPMPAVGRARVDLLKDKEHVRVWINRGGTHYLVHLATVGPQIQ
jgi:hypothetical protein